MDDIDQDGFNNQHKPQDLLSAQQAAELLGIKPATLYAYVSRGLLKSVPADDDAEGGRGHRYIRAELLRLKARAKARSGHGPVAAAALDFGEPVLESALTAVTAAGPHYRGHSAVALCRQGLPFEAIAELLWNGSLPETPPSWPSGPTIAPASLAKLLPAGAAALSALALLVPALAVRDVARFAAPPDVEKARARQLLRQLAAGLALSGDQDLQRFRLAVAQADLASVVAAALTGRAKSARQLSPAIEQGINQALILMADHELNMSTFAARIAASAGADIYACVSAALATLSGPRHGGVCDRVEALLAEAKRPEDAAVMIHERLRRGETIPGFGHPLYPAGDPRTVPMIETAQELGASRVGVRTLLAIVKVMTDAGHAPPTVDLGLVALSLALGLPQGSAACLFAIGRSAGWVAHILEQRESSVGLRPRALYNGPPPRPRVP
jgi:citrate synthase